MDKRSLTERDICTKFIQLTLKDAGWDTIPQVREEVFSTKGRIIVRGKLVTGGQAKKADISLYYKRNNPIALIEAEENKHSFGNGMQQALDFAAALDIPFISLLNSDWFVLHDRTGGSVPVEMKVGVDAFPSPANLWARYRAWKCLDAQAEQIVLQDYFDDGSGMAPRKSHRHSRHPPPSAQRAARRGAGAGRRSIAGGCGVMLRARTHDQSI